MPVRRKRFGGKFGKRRKFRRRTGRRSGRRSRRPKGYGSGRLIRMSRRIIETSHPKQYMNCLILGDSNDTPVLSMVTSQPYVINVTDCIWNAAVQALTAFNTAGSGQQVGIGLTKVFVDKVTIELNVTNLVPTTTYFNGNDIEFTTWRFYNPFFNNHYSINDFEGNKRCQWQALSPLTTANDFPTSALWWGIQANTVAHQSKGDFLYFRDAPVNPTTMLYTRKKKYLIKPHPMQGVTGGVVQNTSSSGTARTFRFITRPKRVYSYQTSASLDLVPGNEPITRLQNPAHNSEYFMICADDYTLQPGVQQNCCTCRAFIRVQLRLMM